MLYSDQIPCCVELAGLEAALGELESGGPDGLGHRHQGRL